MREMEKGKGKDGIGWRSLLGSGWMDGWMDARRDVRDWRIEVGDGGFLGFGWVGLVSCLLDAYKRWKIFRMRAREPYLPKGMRAFTSARSGERFICIGSGFVGCQQQHRASIRLHEVARCEAMDLRRRRQYRLVTDRIQKTVSPAAIVSKSK